MSPNSRYNPLTSLQDLTSPNHPVCLIPPIAPGPVFRSEGSREGRDTPEIFKHQNQTQNQIQQGGVTALQPKFLNLYSTCCILRPSNKYHHHFVFFHPTSRQDTKKKHIKPVKLSVRLKLPLLLPGKYLSPMVHVSCGPGNVSKHPLLWTFLQSRFGCLK